MFLEASIRETGLRVLAKMAAGYPVIPHDSLKFLPASCFHNIMIRNITSHTRPNSPILPPEKPVLTSSVEELLLGFVNIFPVVRHSYGTAVGIDRGSVSGSPFSDMPETILDP
jgi:hypothetical protein